RILSHIKVVLSASFESSDKLVQIADKVSEVVTLCSRIGNIECAPNFRTTFYPVNNPANQGSISPNGRLKALTFNLPIPKSSFTLSKILFSSKT
ncbi:hypothetical protein CEXT_6631, partial [Caerostris extrusa]